MADLEIIDAITGKTIESRDFTEGEIAEKELDARQKEEERLAPDNYAENRRIEYPKIGDQIGAVMDYLAQKDDLTEDLVTLIQKIQDTKDKYPKPE